MNRRLVRIAGFAAALVPVAAAAHDLSARHGAFLGATLHPLLSLDHGLALLALGLLAGQQGGAVAWRVAGATVAGLALGAAAAAPFAIAPGTLPSLTTFNLASLLALGALVAAAPRLPSGAAPALAALFAAGHGLENGIDLAGALTPAALLGLALAGLIATAPPAALIPRLPHGWPQIAVRVAGSWIAAIGLIVLGLEFRAG